MTKIEWTDATWNPTKGCSRVSSGCDNCYAMRQARRFDHEGGAYDGLTRIGKHGVDWSGKVRFEFDLRRTTQFDLPLRWRKPRRVFVNSMSDLFHESLTDAEIAAVFGVMACCPQHVFQILTKRAKRMRAWFEWTATSKLFTQRFPDELRRLAYSDTPTNALREWPLPNVWLGVSTEDQKTADERIPLLLQTPATVRFVSAEPLLGPIDLSIYMATGWTEPPYDDVLNWVIMGGESGRGARPCRLDWVRSIVEQCRDASVQCFVKQLGAHPMAEAFSDIAHLRTKRDRKGGDPAEWPEDLRVRQFPEARSSL